MPLITLRKLQLSYGDLPLLDGIDLNIEKGERIALLGRNGAGKSTLMRVILGSVAADDGERQVSDGTRIAHLIQEVPDAIQGSVFDVVADGVGHLSDKLKTYHKISHQLALSGDERLLQSLSQAQHELEVADGLATGTAGGNDHIQESVSMWMRSSAPYRVA